MRFFFLYVLLEILAGCGRQSPPLVLQSDFGLKDGAVAEMRGVALSVDPELRIYDLTHEIPPYNIWEAAYRLNQTAPYWPAGTIFVSVVDPGVGTDRRSIVMKSGSGHYFVTPDNGTLSLVASSLGIAEVRQIDETVNRRADSRRSYTFYGRDVYVYTAARLASGEIDLKGVGPRLPDSILRMPFQEAVFEDGEIKGNIPVLDVQYGNVWTNIPDSLLARAGWAYGTGIRVQIFRNDSTVYNAVVPFSKTFGDVPEGNPLGYLNSLMNFAVALNMGNFAATHGIQSGPDWTIRLSESK